MQNLPRRVTLFNFHLFCAYFAHISKVCATGQKWKFCAKIAQCTIANFWGPDCSMLETWRRSQEVCYSGVQQSM